MTSQSNVIYFCNHSMKDPVYIYIEIEFPENKLVEWKNSALSWDEFEWDEDMEYLISDLELNTVGEFLEDLKQKKDIFFTVESKDGEKIKMKAYMGFSELSLYFVGLVSSFRKAGAFGANGKAAFISAANCQNEFVMFGFILEKDVFHKYSDDVGADPKSETSLAFGKIWNDTMASEINTEMENMKKYKLEN